MAGPTFVVHVDDDDVRRLFERAPTAVRTRIRQLVEGSAIDVQREERIAANVGVTGNLRRSVTYRVNPAQLSAEITPGANYAESVERGGPPRMVSVAPGSPLREWAILKGINPYALQNSIARKGTKAHPFVEPTYRKMKPRVESDIAAGITTLVAEFNR